MATAEGHGVELPAALAGSPLPTGLVAPDGSWLTCNPVLTSLLGEGPAPFDGLVDEPGLDVARALRTEPAVRLRVVAPDGSSADAVVTRWSDDEPPVRLVQLVDRTEVQALEALSRQAVTALEAFISRVSHDLRNPIGTSRGFAELLLAEEGVDGDARAFAQRIHSSTARAAELLEALVEEARTTERVAPYDEVDVTELVDGIRQELAGLLAERGAAVRTSGRLPLLRGDVRLLHRALATAIRNAVEHHPGAADVVVSAARADRAWELVVDDDGAGVAAEDREAILQHEGWADGPGLGLSLARAAVERRGGQLLLDDSDRGGLRVRLVLPQRRAGDPGTTVRGR